MATKDANEEDNELSSGHELGDDQDDSDEQVRDTELGQGKEESNAKKEKGQKRSMPSSARQRG